MNGRGRPWPMLDRVIVAVLVVVSVVVLGWFVWDNRQDQAREDCRSEQLGDVLAGRAARDC